MHLPLVLFFSLFLIFTFILTTPAWSQIEQENAEILVYVEIPRVGGFDVPAVIKGNDLYLAVSDLFEFLKVRNIPSAGLDSISGFFINYKANYLVDYTASKIRFQDRTYTVIRGDLIRTESNLYLKSEYFGRIFGLDCIFNFRSLTVTINTKLELPVIREMRLAEMRKNLTKIRGEMKSDTSIGRTHPHFRFGMADWSVSATEEINGKTTASASLALGAMVAGGEVTTQLNYNNLNGFKEKQQFYMWRYVNNDFKPLRQVIAGKVLTNATSTLYNPVIGIQLTNTPTTYRRSFGTYKLSDRTEPGWIVELYVNGVIVDYVTADASGFFTFDVPMIYGNTSVKLKFYGPWGEERIKEQNISIPYNFLPAKTLEYNVSAGIVEDSLMSRFSRGIASYGVTKNLTIGGGIEYLSSVTSGPAMPFINSALRITNNIILAGEYTYGVRAKGIFIYRLPSNMQLDLNYTWFEEGQTAINFNYREERKATFAVPLRIGKLYSYQRFSLNQLVLPSSTYTTAEWMFSGSINGINTNLTTYGMIIGDRLPYIYSNLSLSFRLPAKFTLMPQVQYGFTEKELLSTKIRLEKVFGGNAYTFIQYERNYMNGLNLGELGLRYDFAFGQAGLSVRQHNSRTSLIQYARGSVITDTKTGYITADNRANVGRGGITIIPYLDINSNGGRDPGEPRASGLGIHANTGRVLVNEKDTTIRILGLEPYTNCFIEMDGNAFENISWRLPVRTLNIAVDPEILKVVEIPVAVTGEASGTVYIEENSEKNGMARIVLSFYNEFHELAGKAISEEDGYYNYFGLASGEYSVRPDSAQLRKLRLRSSPEFRKFTIVPSSEGGFISDLDFTLTRIPPDTSVVIEEKQAKEPDKQIVEPVKPVVKKDSTFRIVHEITEELFTILEDSYAIQLGAFRKRSNAEAYRKTLESQLGKKVEIVVEKDLFKVRVVGLNDRKEVDDLVAKLQNKGISELWVITQKAKMQEWRLIEKTDTITGIRETIEAGAIPPEMSIQVGAFRREKNALDLQKNLSMILTNPVKVVNEGGFYKVRIAGFSSMEELRKMIPVLRKLGMNDIWIPVVINVQEVKQAAEVLADTAARKPVVVLKPEPVVIVPDTAILISTDTIALRSDTLAIKADTLVVKPVEDKIVEPVVEEKPVVIKPKVYLHFGEFRKRSQALKAQRKVESKLDMPVEIFMKYNSYHLVISGFTDQKETTRFFPELVGMGYTNIYVIKEK